MVDIKVFALCVISFTLGLRLLEAASLTGANLEQALRPPWSLRFFKAKAYDRAPVCERTLMAYPLQWALCLVQLLSTEGGAWRNDPVFSSARALHCAYKSLAHRAGLPLAKWHAWRRGCARTLWKAVSDCGQICTWCRWSGEEMARWYVGPDTADTREELGMPWFLPVPPCLLPSKLTLTLPCDLRNFWPDSVYTRSGRQPSSTKKTSSPCHPLTRRVMVP